MHDFSGIESVHFNLLPFVVKFVTYKYKGHNHLYHLVILYEVTTMLLGTITCASELTHVSH